MKHGPLYESIIMMTQKVPGYFLESGRGKQRLVRLCQAEIIAPSSSRDGQKKGPKQGVERLPSQTWSRTFVVTNRFKIRRNTQYFT